jgi:hypothetical protein
MQKIHFVLKLLLLVAQLPFSLRCICQPNLPLARAFRQNTDGTYTVEGPGWKDTINVRAQVAIQHQ